MGTEGFFFADPAAQDALRQRQAYADALLKAGQADPGFTKYGGIANAGKEILGALLQNWNTSEAKKLSAEDKDKYAKAIASMLSPGETKPGVFPTEAGDLNAMGTSNKGSLVDTLGPDRAKSYADMLSGLQPQQGMQMLPQIAQNAFERQDYLKDNSYTQLDPKTAQNEGYLPGSVVQRTGLGKENVSQASDVMSDPAMLQWQQKERIQQGPQLAANAETARYHAALLQQAEGDVLSDEDAKFKALQAWQGDKSALQGLGYGNIGSKNRAKVSHFITETGKILGKTPADLAAINARYAGDLSASRTLGNIDAKVERAVTETKMLTQQARDASANVTRISGFVPFNRVVQMVGANTSDPNILKLNAAINGKINTYVRAIVPSGQPSDQVFAHARALLEAAQDQNAFNGVLDQLDLEADASSASSPAVRNQIYDRISGKKSAPTQQAQPAQQPKVLKYDQNGNRIP